MVVPFDETFSVPNKKQTVFVSRNGISEVINETGPSVERYSKWASDDVKETYSAPMTGVALKI